MRKIEKNIGLGQRIKSIRLRLGKNQSEFGEMFDPPAPKGAVSRWEHGGGPNKQRLKKIAELGGVSVEYLINGDYLSDAEIKNLHDKILHGSANLTEEEKQKLNAARLDVDLFTNKMSAMAQNRIDRENALIAKHPFSLADLNVYGLFLSLFNQIRLRGTEDQMADFFVIITLMSQVANGNMEYDKEDILPNIDRLLSSFPVKKADERD